METYTSQLEKLGKRVKRLREKMDLTQKELGERVNVNPRTIQRVEAGEFPVGIHTLLLIASVLETDASVLLKGIAIRRK